MIHYIVQTIACQILFLLIYDVFLKKETFFNWNRAYLIATPIISFIVPFIKVKSIREAVPRDYVFSFPTLSPTSQNEIALDEVVLHAQTNVFDIVKFIDIILLMGCMLALLFFIYRLYSIIKIIIKHPASNSDKARIITVPNSNLAFSFFNYVFLGSNLNQEEKTLILKHEMVHILQKHSWDLIFFEILRIPFWFNPLVYMYQNRLSDLHEFIADHEAVKNNKKQYYQNLLSQLFETKQVSFINPFFKKSLIKKRIVMLQKSKSSQMQLIKYTLLIPVVFGMLVYASCTDDNASHASTDEFNLDQYSYTLKRGEELTGEKQAIHENYEAFLKSHNQYVAWAEIDVLHEEISYSVHKASEDVPEGFTRMEPQLPDGSSYVMFMNLPENKEKDVAESSELLNKINAVKEQIEIQGNITEEGEKGIKLLFDMLTLDTAPNTELISEVQKYNSASNKNELHKRISTLFEAIQEQGNMTIEEQLSLKTLLTLVSKKGLSSEFYEEIEDRIEIPYAVIEKTPEFKDAAPVSTEEERKKAFNQSINAFVARNFNTNISKGTGITGVQKISVFFKIGNDGFIKDVKARAASPELEAEAVRVINMLPQMVPGEQKGKKVTVPYYLPIQFQLGE